MSGSVTIYEMGPRDGLQNEKEIIATADKIHLIDLLSEAGFSKIEATSFVSAKWIPQMADAAEVLAGITRKPGVTYGVLTPNLKGFEAALAAGADEVAIFASASESFSQKNINCSIDESFERFVPVIAAANAAGIPVRGYVSCAIACPYEGAIAPDDVARVASRLMQAGCYQVSLGDTIGAGTPATIAAMLTAVIKLVPASDVAGHYHDTGDNALSNVAASLDFGIRTFDSAVGGLGGCPYAPGAKGNVATGPLVAMLEAKGFQTGIDLVKLDKAAVYVTGLVGRLAGA
jgi:hydroxymethylglutaryl-CoA lyase